LNDQNHSPLNQAICDETDGRKKKGRTEGGKDGRRDGWMDGWMDGGREGGREGKTESCLQIDIHEGSGNWESSIVQGEDCKPVAKRDCDMARLRDCDMAIWRYGELSPSPSPSPSHIIENKMLKSLRNYLDVSKKRILR
jgi:hypothetical protein